MKKFLVAGLMVLSFGSDAALACSYTNEIPKLTFVSLTEVNFDFEGGDYIEFFVNKPTNIDVNELVIEVDGKNIYDGFSLKNYNIITKDLVATTEQVLVKYGGEIIDGVCWKNDKVSANEIDDVENFEKLDFGGCYDSGEISNGLHLLKLDALSNDWELLPIDTPGEKNQYSLEDPTAKIDIQSGETIGYNEMTINLDGKSSSDQYGLEMSYNWDFGNGEYSDKENPDAVTYDVGNYVVELTVENSLGYKDEEYLFISVLPEITIDNEMNEEVDQEDEVVDVDESLVDLEIINFMANPEGSDTGNEWIDLRNVGQAGLGLSWELDDQEGQSSSYKLDEVYFESGETKRIYNSESKIGLNNSDDRVRVLKGGEVIDEIVYEKTSSGVSYMENLLDSTGQQDSGANEDSEDEEINIEVIYQYSSDLIITELMPNPEGKDSGNEWVEILNKGEDINLNGWYLLLNSKKVSLDEKYIKSGDYLSVSVSGFSNAGGDVGIYNPKGVLIDEASYEKSVEGESYSLVGDKWMWTKFLSQNKENIELNEEEGEVKNIDSSGQIITIGNLELLYKDLPSEVEIGGQVFFKYMSDELVEIELIEPAEVTLGGLSSSSSDDIEKINKLWVYIIIYSLAFIIAVYYRKSLLEFAKTKFGEI